jgi:hypothetical protein
MNTVVTPADWEAADPLCDELLDMLAPKPPGTVAVALAAVLGHACAEFGVDLQQAVEIVRAAYCVAQDKMDKVP